MKENIILDDHDDQKKVKPFKVKDIRVMAILLEFLPIILLIIFSQITLDTIYGLLFIPVISVIYFLFGWYIFKPNEFNTKEVMITFLSGLYFLLTSIALLFILQSWELGKELLFLGLISGGILLGYCIYRFIRRRDELFEYRFSLKLGSRVFIFLLVKIWLLNLI